MHPKGTMIKFLDKFNYVYALFCILVSYCFFTNLSFKKCLLKIDSFPISTHRHLIDSYPKEERKLLLDFKYRRTIDNSKEKSILIDKECRILGYKSFNSRENISSNFTFYLHKKLAYSTLFGSIRLIRL
uniref:Uncharacterized protein n=1 Tax=Cryptomonas curvata TaxID=233186 RepID=A0A222AH71_9CRYP|nr:hypothetical protein [Cryptomonas curvata]ASO75714.1 hypothetical protein [Cryptomonas curvata]